MLNKIIKISVFLFAMSSFEAYAEQYQQENKEEFIWPTATYGRGFVDDTYLILAQQGTLMSKKVSDIRYQSIENAFGQKISFEKWYKNKYNWIDSQFMWLTQVDKNSGILWGFTTGEKGEKYFIKPSVSIGLLQRYEINKNSSISFQMSFQFGGRLKERSCIADYGEVGGIQRVNCRLAATELEPKETLKYLFNEEPKDHQFMIKYQLIF